MHLTEYSEYGIKKVRLLYIYIYIYIYTYIYIYIGNLLDLTLIHEGLINGLEWNSTGKYLLTAGDDGRVYVLDKANRHNGQMFEHGASVLDVSWKNEREFASGGVDGIIKLWHLGDDHPFNSFEACSGHIKSIKWDKAGSLLACSTQDTVLKVLYIYIYIYIVDIFSATTRGFIYVKRT